MSFKGSKISPIDIDKVKKGRQEWTKEEISNLLHAVTEDLAVEKMIPTRTKSAIIKKAWTLDYGFKTKDGLIYLKDSIQHSPHQRKPHKKSKVKERPPKEPVPRERVPAINTVQKKRPSKILDNFTDLELSKILLLFQNELGRRLCG